ncbi:hypothetical protein OK016_10375 [Vibrio chagasii]|nr:hypothetical protein [Vibrio chagasii]
MAVRIYLDPTEDPTFIEGVVEDPTKDVTIPPSAEKPSEPVPDPDEGHQATNWRYWWYWWYWRWRFRWWSWRLSHIKSGTNRCLFYMLYYQHRRYKHSYLRILL